MVAPRLALRDDLRLALDRVAFTEKLGIVPDGWQEDFLRSSADRVLLNCSRQSGKSTMSAVIALHRALYHPGSLVLCLAPALRQPQELFAKIAGFYRDLGRPVAPQGERKLSLELENDSRIITLPGSEKTIRGFSGAALLLVDEASRVDDALYFAIRPMLAVSGGSLMMLSHPLASVGCFLRSGPADTDGSATRPQLVSARAYRLRSSKRSGQRFLRGSTAKSMSAASRKRRIRSSPPT
jgi:hypothetical protein